MKWLVLRPRRGLNSSEKMEPDHLLQANPPLALGDQLKEWFHEIVKQGDLEALDVWSLEASRSGLKQFKSIARSFRQEFPPGLRRHQAGADQPKEHWTMRGANLPG